jgi:hypothetical protein
LNDEPANREEIPSPSEPREQASSVGRSANSTFKVRDASERPSRKEKSALRKFLPPILGGLAALPLATAILWYGFGRDLGGIGPSVAQYAPWIVPKKLRGSGFRSDGTFGSSNSGYDVGPVPDISSKRLASDGFKSALPSLGSDSRPASPKPAPIEDKSVGSTEISLPRKKSESTDTSNQDTSDADATPAAVIEEKMLQEETKLLDIATVQVPDEEPLRAGAIDKLLQSLQELSDLKEKWPSIPRERAVQLKAVSDFYGHLCDLAKWIDQPDEGVIELWNERKLAIANMILGDSKFSALTQRCASGEIPNVVSLEANRYVVTVIPSGMPVHDELVDSSKELTIETVVAGMPMTVVFSAENNDLIRRVRSVEPGNALLLFLRIDNRDQAFRLIALDIMTASEPQ